MDWDVRLRQINLETGATIKEFDVVLGAQNSVELAMIIGGAYRGDVHLISFKPKIPGLQKVTIVEKPEQELQTEKVGLNDSPIVEAFTPPSSSPTPSKELPLDVEVSSVELHSKGGGLESTSPNIESETYESVELGSKEENLDEPKD